MFRRLSIGLCLLFLLSADVRGAEGTFDSDGVKIHYAVEGEGEPVVLIHGFSLNHVLQWGMPGIAKSLAKDYQVIALDARGHGRSGKPHDPKLYGVEMVADVVRLLDHLKIKKAHVVGYSMGTFIALKLAMLHPDRLLSLTLGGAGWAQTGEAAFLDQLADEIEQGKGIGLLIRRLTPAGHPKPTDEQLQATNRMFALFNDRKAMAAVMRALKQLAVPEEALKQIRLPTLALIGELDPLKDGVDALPGRLPDVRIIVIEGADHMNAFAKPEFLQGLQAFLAKHSNGKKTTAGAPQ
jgi:pimeloyl-ACP methyl ester carboxylesterase